MQLSLNENILIIKIENKMESDQIFERYHIGKKQRYFHYQNGFYVNGIAKKQNVHLYKNDMVTIQMLDEKDEIAYDPHPIDICYEDDIVLIVNKPAYLLVHSDGSNTSKTLYNRVAYYYHQKKYPYKVRAIHRLDYETSGLVFFCKVAFFQPLLDHWLSAKKIHREYLAICEGILKNDITINKPIGRDRHDAKKMRISPNGKYACTHVKVIKQTQHKSLIHCRLETGRTHQIRVHLASIGHPLLHDKLYGKASKERMLLHAFRISFLHPLTNQEKVVECRPDFLKTTH